MGAILCSAATTGSPLTCDFRLQKRCDYRSPAVTLSDFLHRDNTRRAGRPGQELRCERRLIISQAVNAPASSPYGHTVEPHRSNSSD